MSSFAERRNRTDFAATANHRAKSSLRNKLHENISPRRSNCSASANLAVRFRMPIHVTANTPGDETTSALQRSSERGTSVAQSGELRVKQALSIL